MVRRSVQQFKNAEIRRKQIRGIQNYSLTSEQRKLSAKAKFMMYYDRIETNLSQITIKQGLSQLKDHEPAPVTLPVINWLGMVKEKYFKE